MLRARRDAPALRWAAAIPAPQALRLPTFDGRKYWLEYRKPIGFDVEEGIDGVLVHVSSAGAYWGPEAFTIDLGEGALIHAGETYSDPSGTVTFIVAEELDTHAVIDVVFPDGGSGSPQCLDGSTPMQVGAIPGAPTLVAAVPACTDGSSIAMAIE